MLAFLSTSGSERGGRARATKYGPRARGAWKMGSEEGVGGTPRMRRTIMVVTIVRSKAGRRGDRLHQGRGCPPTDEHNSCLHTSTGTRPFVRKTFAVLAAYRSSEPLDLSSRPGDLLLHSATMSKFPLTSTCQSIPALKMTPIPLFSRLRSPGLQPFFQAHGYCGFCLPETPV